MIDWHCHILPGMDDGSRDTDESLALMQMLGGQGVDTVIATPHFYANDESVADFVSRRQEAYETLCPFLSESLPNLLLGAEVRYYPGIGKLSELNQLCIGNSRLLLLEMPMEKWTEYTVRELVEMANARRLRLILAHIERYLLLQNSENWNRLYSVGIMMQVNASYFVDFSTRRKAFSLFKNGGIQLIGSDSHGLKHRPPRLGKAYDLLRRRFGDEFVTQFTEYGESALEII